LFFDEIFIYCNNIHIENAQKITYWLHKIIKKNLDNYLKGKSFTVKPLDQEDEDNTVVKLQYKAKKNLSKFNKNLSMGKGVRIQPVELEDMQIHSGNGLFDSLKGVMNSKLTKGIVKAVAPKDGNIVGQQVII
jgi:hypothetical protein